MDDFFIVAQRTECGFPPVLADAVGGRFFLTIKEADIFREKIARALRGDWIIFRCTMGIIEEVENE